MTYPCARCNMDEGSPVCLQDQRCPRHGKQAYAEQFAMSKYASSADRSAAMFGELERLTRELANARAADIHSCHASCTRAGCVAGRLQERVKVLEDALRHIERVMGPKVPPCCDGCHYEWGEALKTVRAALGATP